MFAQRVLYGLELRPYSRGGALQKIPLLMEGLMQARVGSLQVLACHLGHDGHQRSPPLHLLIQLPSLRRLRPCKSPKIPAYHYNIQAIPPEEGLL